MSWKENINTIKEIFPGHFQIILDFATTNFLKYAISDSYKYVWVCSFKTIDSLEWKNYNLPLLDNLTLNSVIARDISFSFALPTIEFKDLYNKLGAGIHLAQVNELPKYYLNPDRIKGKARYDLLRDECDYLFEIDLPSATDYGTIVSSKRDYLQSLLDNIEIDWANLP